MTKVRRSVNAEEKDLVVSCDFENCERRFLNLGGMRTHLNKTHGVTSKGRKTVEGETYCQSCKKDFSSNKSYLSHGPIVCEDRRSKLWRLLKCQDSICGKDFEKYVGSKGDRKGQKYCSTTCSARGKREDAAKTWVQKDLLFVGYKILDSYTEYSKKCKTCDELFTTTNPTVKFCQRECIRYVISDTSNMGGLRPGGGYSKDLKFVSKSGDKMSLNIEEIRVAEFLDSTDMKWKRNSKGFAYVDFDGNSRKFHPDFYVEDLDLYIEYKGWTTPEMLHKMNDADRRNSDLNLLILVGDSPRFAEHGLCISDLEKDPSLFGKRFT